MAVHGLSCSQKSQRQKVVCLNVGGTVFHTSISTLTSVPSSYFGRMFSVYWEDGGSTSDSQSHERDVKSSTVFIDRDGAHFRYILNFLRDGEEAVLPDNVCILQELLQEAKFYCLEGLVLYLNRRLLDVGRRLREDKDELLIAVRNVQASVDNTNRLVEEKLKYILYDIQDRLVDIGAGSSSQLLPNGTTAPAQTQYNPRT